MSVENKTVNGLSFEDLIKDHQRVKIYPVIQLGWTSGFKVLKMTFKSIHMDILVKATFYMAFAGIKSYVIFLTHRKLALNSSLHTYEPYN